MTEALAGEMSIERLVRRMGPISVADYMALCLAHPEAGYYRTRDPLGAGGDFVTAPEISQMYGELVGAWCCHAWEQVGSPDPFHLVELGPGRGTMMADIIRVGHHCAPFARALRLILVESSPTLGAIQNQALSDQDVAIEWVEDLGACPEGPALILASEFFDALPTRQYVRQGQGWRERMVGSDGAGGLVFTTGPGFLPDLNDAPAMNDPSPREGTIVEVSPARNALVGDIARRCTAGPGAALIIDYGDLHLPPAGTLQAVKDHQRVDPLSHPGQADLSSHVDFQAVRQQVLAMGARCHGPLTQGGFLTALGLEARAAALAAGASPDATATVRQATHRLTGSDAMGDLFKVLAVGPPGIDLAPF